MGLISCPDCGSQLSDLAPACIKCGRPIAGTAATTPLRIPNPRAPQEVPAKRRTSLLTWLVTIIAGLWLVGYLSTMSKRQDGNLLTGPDVKPTVVANLKDEVKQQLTFDFEWGRGGFDTVLEINATLSNKSAYDLKDFSIRCEGSAGSGTHIDTNKKTLFETVKKGQTRRFNKFSMGFLNSQVKSLSCRIDDFVII